MIITEHTNKHLKILFDAKSVKMRFEHSFVNFSIRLKEKKDLVYLLSLAKSVFPKDVIEDKTKLIGETYNLRISYVSKQGQEA